MSCNFNMLYKSQFAPEAEGLLQLLRICLEVAVDIQCVSHIHTVGTRRSEGLRPGGDEG